MNKQISKYLGKYILRDGDIHAEEITNELICHYSYSEKFLDKLNSMNLIFESKDEAESFRDIILGKLKEKGKIMEVWHDGKEEPKDKSKVILFQVGDKTKTVWTMEYHKEDKKFHVTSPLGNDYIVGLDWPNIRWAYPGDILPNK